MADPEFRLTKVVKDSSNYEQPTVKFCDIDQDIFGPQSQRSSKGSRKLHKTMLVVDDDETEAIDDDEAWE